MDSISLKNWTPNGQIEAVSHSQNENNNNSTGKKNNNKNIEKKKNTKYVKR